ncbi:phospholipid carrier-dependent glycosyltransferase [Leifsonia sp. 71-9]|uniref:dolichyl-phosphate-mannose--protein mannosyltransferase n=1 Tax=Leifsonia sp. 71-9 TaxID=1895934 RepID=UPI0009258B07|nr:phospholipid carrier-dependent glycosyltransferase [Leifsonia sp. 71-9]OJX72589.1 MAG: phospholipid carrier-dependent glycosyltransferase [Leifsonia sp. 71-9]
MSSLPVTDPVPAHAAPGPIGSRIDDWWARVLRTPTRLRIWYWGAPIGVTLLAAVLRLWDLGSPHALVFDETFYVKDAWSLSHLGYEGSWPDKADQQFAAGNTDIFTSSPSFVAHPPLGKWIIALGMAATGAGNSFGWRVSTAVVGILAVLVVFLIARALFTSTVIAAIAGFLMAIDGHAIVMSRVALLDNSVMFFGLLAFGCILLDRRWHATRLAAAVSAARSAGRDPAWGPVLWWRPWLIAAGILCGLCAGVKWSGFYFLAFFAVYTVVVDAVARRRAGLAFYLSGAALKQGPATFVLMVPIAFVVYVSTWTGWIVTDGGYYRHWAESTHMQWTGLFSWVPLWAQNLWYYQTQMYNYSINLHVPHPYQSNPLTWLFMIRPTSMYYVGTTQGQGGCDVSSCSAAITSLGNPLIWWAGAAAVFYLIYRLARYRDWRLGLILTGLAAGYLPWLLYINRTIFQFYSIAFEPYLILGLAAAIAVVLGRRTDPTPRRRRGIAWVTVFLVASAVLSIFFWPIWTGEQIPFWFWQMHMWLPSWV